MHLVGFITKKIVTMYGHMNVKKKNIVYQPHSNNNHELYNIKISPALRCLDDLQYIEAVKQETAFIFVVTAVVEPN